MVPGVAPGRACQLLPWSTAQGPRAARPATCHDPSFTIRDANIVLDAGGLSRAVWYWCSSYTAYGRVAQGGHWPTGRASPGWVMCNALPRHTRLQGTQGYRHQSLKS